MQLHKLLSVSLSSRRQYVQSYILDGIIEKRLENFSWRRAPRRTYDRVHCHAILFLRFKSLINYLYTGHIVVVFNFARWIARNLFFFFLICFLSLSNFLSILNHFLDKFYSIFNKIFVFHWLKNSNKSFPRFSILAILAWRKILHQRRQKCTLASQSSAFIVQLWLLAEMHRQTSNSFVSSTYRVFEVFGPKKSSPPFFLIIFFDFSEFRSISFPFTWLEFLIRISWNSLVYFELVKIVRFSGS